jgi:exosome complex RNA-binding protein Csl4
LHVCYYFFFWNNSIRTLSDILGIISLGDANAYLLSTAEENLGVIAARSAAGKLILKMIIEK